MSHETIERDGKIFVLVPEKQFEKLIEASEDLADIAAYDRAKAKPQEFVPAEIADRIIAGENKLRVWREYRGFTQRHLSALASVSTPYLSQLESELRKPSVGVLQKLARALSVDLDDLA